MAKKYDFFNVSTPYEVEIFENYREALSFYGQSENPATLYGCNVENNDYSVIKSKK